MLQHKMSIDDTITVVMYPKWLLHTLSFVWLTHWLRWFEMTLSQSSFPTHTHYKDGNPLQL